MGEVNYHAQPVHLLYHSLKQRHSRVPTKFVNFAAVLLFAKNITSILSYKINLKKGKMLCTLDDFEDADKKGLFFLFV